MLQTERLYFRTPEHADGDLAVACLSDYETARLLARVPHPYTEKDWHWYLDNIVAGQDEAVRAICRRDNDEFLGVISMAKDGPLPELGYWLVNSARGQGFATEASIAWVRHYFAQSKTCKIASGYFAENAASGRVLSKVGFRVTGEHFVQSVARGEEKILHIDMELDRDQFGALYPVG